MSNNENQANVAAHVSIGLTAFIESAILGVARSTVHVQPLPAKIALGATALALGIGLDPIDKASGPNGNGAVAIAEIAGAVVGTYIGGAVIVGAAGPIILGGVASLVFAEVVKYAYENNSLGFADLVDGTVDAASAAGQAALQFADQIGEALGRALQSAGEFLSNLPAATADFAQSFVDALSNALGSLAQNLAEFFGPNGLNRPGIAGGHLV